MPGPSGRSTERGVIAEAHPNAVFTVRLADGQRIRASLSGKLRTRYTRLGVSDGVVVERSPYDQTRGVVVGRDQGAGDDPGAAQRVLR